MIFKIKIAEKIIEIHSLYNDVYNYCTEYLSQEEKKDITIEITRQDILFEKEKSSREQLFEGKDPTAFPESYLEITTVYRKICVALTDYNIFLMHGSVVAVDNKAYLFTAPSGTGKTFHINLWLKHIEGSYVVNGDKPLLSVRDEVFACGTPWSGKEKMHTNSIVKLKAIVLLERSHKNEITEISPKEAFSVILGQAYRTTEKKQMLKTIELINKTISKVKLYRLKCNMQDEAAITAYEFIK